MGKFEGIYFFTDMDGTMITADFKIPQRNIDAIKYFIENGGHFALATGRGPHFETVVIMKMLGLNFPCIMLNGALFYDPIKQEAVDTIFLDNAQGKELIKVMTDNFSDHYIITAWLKSKAIQFGIENPHFRNIDKGENKDIDEEILKIVFGHQKGIAPQDAQLVKSHVGDKLYVTNASDNFIEVMAKGISKGQRLEWVIENYSLDRRKVVAMGDYYNDLEMLSLKGIRAFCPQNAADDIKNVCEKVFCHVDDGAIADAIEYLDNEIN